MQRTHPRAKTGKTLVVVGAGGNIGSHLVGLLARLAEVLRLILLDRDRYEAGNLPGQDIAVRDVGRPKVLVQASRVHRIRPDLEVVPIHDAIENVPLGLLRADLILAALDSREARRLVNQAAWRLSVPWIDGGVAAAGLLARVNVYRPGPGAACMECAWDGRDYAAASQAYPCLGRTQRDFPTRAPAHLGALTAALQAIECQKILAGQWDRVLTGQQLLVDGLYHKQYVTTILRNPRCRFDHAPWRLRSLDGEPHRRTLDWLLRTERPRSSPSSPALLHVEGDVFVRQLSCLQCRATRDVLVRQRRLTPAQRRCGRCGAAMAAAAHQVVHKLPLNVLPARYLLRTLADLGFRDGDVFTLSQHEKSVHYAIGDDQPGRAA